MLFYLFNKKASFIRLAFFIFFLLGFSTWVQAKQKSFPVKEEIKKPLTVLTDLSVSLHRAVYNQNTGQADLLALKMIQQMDHLQQTAGKILSLHENAYLNKLLQGLRFNLEVLRASRRYKQNYINTINRKLTYIAHIYGLKNYTVFFCPADRSVWMQDKKNKPLHLSHTACGIPVSNR